MSSSTSSSKYAHVCAWHNNGCKHVDRDNQSSARHGLACKFRPKDLEKCKEELVAAFKLRDYELDFVVCDVAGCGKTFVDAGRWKFHCETYHGSEKLTCSFCKKGISTYPSALKRHEKNCAKNPSKN